MATVRRSLTVKPAEALPPKSINLTEWDQIGLVTHVPTIYFYRPLPEWNSPPEKLFLKLRDSLSIALVHFPPIAGRLRWTSGERLELECNSAGAELVEADSDSSLEDFGDFSPSPEFKCLIPSVDYRAPLEELPLLIAQLTRFRCGGISLGFMVSHAIADGRSSLHFIREWAAIARGEYIGAAPFLDRCLFPRRGHEHTPVRFHHIEYDKPPLLIGETSTENQRKKTTSNAALKLDKLQVEKLKKLAESWNPQRSRPYTRYEVITAHIWRCASMARGLRPEQLTGLGVCADFRRRIRTPLPENYFGNAVMDVVAMSRSGDLILPLAVARIRETIELVTEEYVRSAASFLREQSSLKRFQDIHDLAGFTGADEGSFHGNPNLGVTSWLRLPIYGVDFGWGEEIHMGPDIHNVDGDVLLLPARGEEGSVLVLACFHHAHMDSFKKLFYDGLHLD